jgi:predicted ATPase/class 3 adenylate cyclase
MILRWSFAMPVLPTGTITFLFTDIAGSTRLWQEHPQLMPVALARHDAILRQAIEVANGFVVKTAGDAFMAVFATQQDGLQAALTAQRALCAELWPTPLSLRVRMGLHTGVTEERDNDYYGHEVNRAARIQAVGHPQQIVLSQSVYEGVKESLPDTVALLDLGLHQLKDLNEPEALWQLCHPDLPATFPPLDSLSHWPNNLPRQTTIFIGREAQIAEGQRLLERGACLTLVGAGGCGKTRLALQIAAEALPEYPHGVWLTELAAVTEPGLVASSVASVLGLREQPGKTITQTLVEYARSRTLLLVLDNCEHLLVACAQLVDTLLRSCSHVKVLATSREPLNLKAEQTFRVPSLSLPDPKSPTLDSLRQCEASRLFIERATAVKADFLPTERNALAIAQVCQRLDGIPLAIELAAARVKVLTVEEINARLDHRFRLLTGGDRMALPRQQTLRALIDWSYDLLTEAEKTMLRRLSVFAGGWTLASSEAVCAGEGTSGEGIEEWEVLDLLSSLVDKSLVVAQTQDKTTRYPLLETVRQYARDRLIESGESEAVQRRHRDYFLALAEEAKSQLAGADQRKWLKRLEAEYENLRAGLDWSRRAKDSAESFRFCGALQVYWRMQSHYTEGREWCVRALETAGGKERSPACAETLHGAGIMAGGLGDYAASRTYHEESLAIRKEVGDRSGIAASLHELGIVGYYQGDYASSLACQQESLVIRREIGDRSGIAYSLNGLGIVASAQGDYVSARAYHAESLTIRKEIGDRIGISVSLNNLGQVAYSQGDYASALNCWEESLPIQQEMGDRHGICVSLNSLGHVAQAQGNYAAAGAYYEESLTIRREIGDRRGIAASLNGLGIVAYFQGDYASARAYYEESLMIRREMGDRSGIAYSLEAFARLSASESRLEQTAALWASADILREQIGAPRPPIRQEVYARDVAYVRQALGEEAFSVAWEEGRAMTMEQAVEYALTGKT